jgi:hypothetical protein
MGARGGRLRIEFIALRGALVAIVLWFWFCYFCALHALVPALPFDGQYRYPPHVEMVHRALTSGPCDTAISSMITRTSLSKPLGGTILLFIALANSCLSARRALISPSSWWELIPVYYCCFNAYVVDDHLADVPFISIAV